MTTPFPTQELSALQNGNADTFQALTNALLEAGHKITLLNLEMTRNAINQGGACYSLMASPEQQASIVFQPVPREVAAYCKSLAHISAEAQVEVARQLQSYLSSMGKSLLALLDRAAKTDSNVGTAMATAALKSAVATATASCQSLTETARRVSAMAEANASALADTVQSIGTPNATAAHPYKKAA